MALDQAVNRYYCKESFRCLKASGCNQAITQEIIELHKKKRCMPKYTPLTPSCFKDK